MIADRDGPTEDDPGTSGEGGPRDGRDLDAILADVIPALAGRLRASGLAELEVRTADWRVRVRRETGTGSPTDASAPRTPGSGSAVGPVRGPAAARSGITDEAGMARSPAVGYFLPTPSAEVGRPVRGGDVLGHVEMLGIHHDVTAPLDGVVIRSLAASGQAVEYGQPLILVEPGGSLARAGAPRPQGGGD